MALVAAAGWLAKSVPAFQDVVHLPLWVILVAGAAIALVCYWTGWRMRRPPHEAPAAKAPPAVSIVDIVVNPIEPNRTYPLKRYVILRNKSREAIDVRIDGFTPEAITIKKQQFEVLEVYMGTWLPTPNGLSRVAVLPDERFRLWMGVDEHKFTLDSVRLARGHIGKLSLRGNNQVITLQI